MREWNHTWLYDGDSFPHPLLRASQFFEQELVKVGENHSQKFPPCSFARCAKGLHGQSIGCNLLIKGVDWSYSPLTNLLLTSWDMIRSLAELHCCMSFRSLANMCLERSNKLLCTMKDTPSPKSHHSKPPAGLVSWCQSRGNLCCLGVWGYIDKYFSTQRSFYPATWESFPFEGAPIPGSYPGWWCVGRFRRFIFFLSGNDQLLKHHGNLRGPGPQCKSPGPPRKGRNRRRRTFPQKLVKALLWWGGVGKLHV